MDKYEVLCLIGEGSFGRVFKAKRRSSNEIVAMKVIRKRGRSSRELHSLRQECEIQQHLNHPNIIKMLDSFETENELVVITEYAAKDLFEILYEEGYLHESLVQNIVSDLLSALYYLHSHRVLHRDLKPQNILMDVYGVAKLCDFGFARSMSAGTYVLTSIKGTPLYMAPELIEEKPYDHTADLWSLGCIVYEMLVGRAPFYTSSILHLVKLIKHEEIKWPDFLSEVCVSFVKGLLQKDPSKRLTWPELLEHPFLKRGVRILEEEGSVIPLTNPLTASQAAAKEFQRQGLAWKLSGQSKLLAHTLQKIEAQRMCNKYPDTHYCSDRSVSVSKVAHAGDSIPSVKSCQGSSTTPESKVADNISNDLSKMSLKLGCGSHNSKNSDMENIVSSKKSAVSGTTSHHDVSCKEDTLSAVHSWQSNDDAFPIENEEWHAFLKRNMEEVMITGDVEVLRQNNFVSMIISPLRNPCASHQVVEFVVCLLLLPFAVKELAQKRERSYNMKVITDEDMLSILQTYQHVKVIPNLMYALKLLMTKNDDGNPGSSSPCFTRRSSRPVSDLSTDELQVLERACLLMCHLVLTDVNFLVQFCDAVVVLNFFSLLHRCLLLGRRKVRIVIDLISILSHILKMLPENSDLVEEILFTCGKPDCSELDVCKMLTHSSDTLRAHACTLLQRLGRCSASALETRWSPSIREDLEALIYDSCEEVRNAAENAVAELNKLSFYNQKT